MVFVGCNVSDRKESWQDNYRIPDVAVFLAGNPAQDCDTHWCGGPDWAAEFLSPGDRSRDKLDFYSKVGVRELLLIDRDPWAIELFQRKRGRLSSIGTASLAAPRLLPSAVLPLTFTLVKGTERPLLEIVHQKDQRRWQI